MSRLFRICLLSLLASFTVKGNAQNRWTHSYLDGQNVVGRYITESYDKGYLLSGQFYPNYPKYNWIIKTDINGEILWQKTIGNGINTLVFLEMITNQDGCIYICGEASHEDPYGDPIVIKLNACGEKEWCKVLYSEDHHDFAHCICPTPDGGCAVTLDVTGAVLYEDRICLAKFSPDGEMEWKQCYNSSDSLMGNEIDENLIMTPDHGFFISGWCYYADPTGTLAWLHPYYIKTDSIGNIEWELVVEKESGDSGGEAWQTTLSPDNQYFYSSISHYYHENNTTSPALVKINMEGNLVAVYDLTTPDEIGKLFDARFINDSLLAASASWGNDELNSPMAVIIDTLGNIVDSAALLINDYMSYVRPVHDNKILFYTQTHISGEFDVYLFKLNQDLEDDTLYSFPFTYDSLCPYQISADTLGYENCDLIVGIAEEEKWRRGEEKKIEVWPNPASSVLSFKVLGLSSEREYYMEIYDIFGRLAPITAFAAPIPGPFRQLAEKGEWTVDVSALPPGLYLLVVKDGKEVKASAKFLVVH
jgi:hypothetical protein